MASCNLPPDRKRHHHHHHKDRKYWSHPSNNIYPQSTPDSLNNNASSSASTSKTNRNSFIHHDVQEALNSLLWQPYEYQNKQSLLSSSSSSCCVSVSLSDGDLDNNNKDDDYDHDRSLPTTTPSTASSLSCSCSSSSSDLEMVNNLHSGTPQVVQSRAELGSRDRISSTASRLSGEAAIATTTSLFEYLLAAGEDAVVVVDQSEVHHHHHQQNFIVNSNTNNNNNNSDVVKEWYCGDVYEKNMQFEVTANQHATNILKIQTDQQQQKNNVLLPTAAAASLSSANVVGLPEHPASRRASSAYHHPRNASEPSMVPYTSGIHSRSASVPKSMPQQQNNVSNVNVNFYRAVPVNVVSSVPTIQCLNTLNNVAEGNSVSNVQIMPLGNTTQVTVHTSGVNIVPVRPVRTFTSTEAQTDEISVCEQSLNVQQQQQQPPLNNLREQRRKERRERRHQKRSTHHRHTVDNGTQASLQQSQTHQPQPHERLPDLLNSHMPPPYSPLSSSQPGLMVPSSVIQSGLVQVQAPSGGGGLVAFPAPPPPQVVAGGPVPLVQAAPTGFRFPFPAGGFRRGRFSEEPPKGCCGLLSWKPGSLRWFIAVIALVAVCCVLVGTALGAMRPAGRDHLTVSLLMIGVGIVLVTVSGVAWRLTSHDSSTCRSMLGLGSTESVDVCTRRFVPRLPPSYGRPHHPYAAMMYPEFQYRPPPPSYQASMQEYRLRLLLLDRGNTPQIQNSLQNAVSPPPTYRSHAGSLLRAPLSSRREAAQSEYSCPPSYRSQNSTVLRSTGTLHHHHHHNSVLHSREQSLSLSETNTIRSATEAVVNVVNILGGGGGSDETDSMALDSLKLELLGNSNSDLVDATGGTKDGNLVTIVQTSDQNPVIVTVSGSSQIEGGTVQITEIPTEMEILAHL